MIVVIIVIVILCAIAAIAIIVIIRNGRVYAMRSKLVDTIFRDDDYNRRLKIFRKVSHKQMAFDVFKPLKLETYWTKEEIDEMLYN